MDELGGLQLRALLSATPLAVAVCDAEGWLTLMSPALQELVGPFERVHSSEFVERFGLRDEDGHHPLRAEQLPMVRALRGEVVRDALLTAGAAGRRRVFLRTSAAPIRGVTGQVLGAVAVVQDVTADEAAARERDRLRARLMETVNHEFRTPLTKLQGHVELLLDDDGVPAQMRRSMEVIAQATHDLATLVRTVSELSDLEAQTRLSREQIDLSDLLDDVVEEARRFLPRRGGSLVLDASSHVSALADRGKLKRALLEILHNATIYGPPDTEVVLRLAGEGDEVVLSVIDAGPGISPHERTRLIQPFERGDHPHQSVNSKGLGLAIAHSVAVAHGGDLSFEDEADGFATTLRLPTRPKV